MITPAGEECRFYYEDFNRGRQTQECRLVARSRDSGPWTPSLCAKCPVPGILWANGSPDLRLEGRVVKRFGFLRRMEIKAFCLRCIAVIEDPIRGCPTCAGSEPLDDGRRG